MVVDVSYAIIFYGCFFYLLPFPQKNKILATDHLLLKQWKFAESAQLQSMSGFSVLTTFYQTTVAHRVANSKDLSVFSPEMVW